jgi:hypothetical protein
VKVNSLFNKKLTLIIASVVIPCNISGHDEAIQSINTLNGIRSCGIRAYNNPMKTYLFFASIIGGISLLVYAFFVALFNQKDWIRKSVLVGFLAGILLGYVRIYLNLVTRFSYTWETTSLSPK